MFFWRIFSNHTYTDSKPVGKKKVLQSEIALEKFSDFHEKHEIFNFSWNLWYVKIDSSFEKSLKVKKMIFWQLP